MDVLVKAKKTLEGLNPWWHGGNLPAEDEFPRRIYFPNFERLVFEGRAERAVVLAGLRRAGKTTMLKQLVAAAIAKGFYKPQQVVFVSGDTYGSEQRTLLSLVHSIRERFHLDEDWLLLVDEIQFFADWRRDMTYIADHMPCVKCAATSSSDMVLNLWKQMTETGLGRILELELPPLLFCEYLQFIKAWPSRLPEDDFHAILATRLDEAALDKLNKEFINYINFGAFPQLAYAHRENSLKSSFDELAREIKSDTVVAYLGGKRLPRLLGVPSAKMLNSLCDYLIDSPDGVYVQERCRTELQISRSRSLARCREFLEGIYFIRASRKFDEALQMNKFRHDHCRFILENCSLPSLARQPVKAKDPSLGKRVRNAVLAQFDRESSFEELGYIRGRRKTGREFEIDFCHLDARHKPLMLAKTNWTNSASHFKQADSAMAYLLKQWGKSKEDSPELYCTSKTIYDPGVDFASKIQVVPAAQLSIALGVKRIQNKLFG